LTSALAAGEWSASCAGRFTPGERAPNTHCIGGWVEPRVGLDGVERTEILLLPEMELRHLGHPRKPGGLELNDISQLFIYSGVIIYLVTD
jgi:hypothetical protein